jgi:predicted dehydrogenase
LLPNVEDDGWYHIPQRGDVTKAKWPQPTPGAFNYYHESSRHLIQCILQDTEPLINVDWGLHITEMMAAAVESSRTGTRYEMTTTLAI